MAVLICQDEPMDLLDSIRASIALLEAFRQIYNRSDRRLLILLDYLLLDLVNSVAEAMPAVSSDILCTVLCVEFRRLNPTLVCL